MTKKTTSGVEFKFLVVFIFTIFVLSGCVTVDKGYKVEGAESTAEMQISSKFDDELFSKKLPAMTADEYEMMGDSLLSKGNLHLAFLQYERSLECNPLNIRVEYKKGLTLLAGKKSDDAIKQFNIVLQKKPGHAAAYEGLGRAFFQKQHYGFAEKNFRKALELDPNFTDVLAFMGQALMIENMPEEAIEKVHKAVKLDPLNDAYKGLYTMCLYFTKHYDEAYSFIVDAQKKNPENVFLNSSLRAVYHAKRMYAEEFESWVNKYAMTGDTAAVRELKRGYEQGGYELALQRLAEHLIKNFNYTPEFVPAWQIATLYTRIGKKDEALTWLEKAYELHSISLPFIYFDPLFDSMRHDPRFISLVNKMNLHL